MVESMQLRSLVLALIAVLMLGLGIAIGYFIAPPRESIVERTITYTYTHTMTSPVYQTLTVVQTVEKRAPVSIVDALGRIITFEEFPKRVISLAPSITEILFALGLGDKVVGVTSYCNYPPEVPKLVEEGKLTTIGGYWNPDIEKIIALKPDLVIGSSGTRSHVELKDKLEGLGIKTVYIRGSGASSVEEVLSDIATIAKIFGVEDKANELVNNISSEISYVVNKLMEANVTKLKVFVLLGPPTWGLYSVGGDTFLGWVLFTAGGNNIASKYSGWPLLDFEYVVSHDPDVIIATSMGLNPEDVVKEIGNTLLKETKAFKEGRVYVVSQEAEDILVRPGPRIGKAVRLMAQILYPEIFGNPEVEMVFKIK
ncbi:MAG: ABC transporter substrate-binding protein [Ignisphaera sp.]